MNVCKMQTSNIYSHMEILHSFIWHPVVPNRRRGVMGKGRGGGTRWSLIHIFIPVISQSICCILNSVWGRSDVTMINNCHCSWCHTLHYTQILHYFVITIPCYVLPKLCYRLPVTRCQILPCIKTVCHILRNIVSFFYIRCHSLCLTVLYDYTFWHAAKR